MFGLYLGLLPGGMKSNFEILTINLILNINSGIV